MAGCLVGDHEATGVTAIMASVFQMYGRPRILLTWCAGVQGSIKNLTCYTSRRSDFSGGYSLLLAKIKNP